MSQEAPKPIERKTKEELLQIAKDIVDRKIFCNMDLDEVDLLGSVFMPIGLGGFAGADKEWIDSIGLIYEYLDKAQNRSINGYPIFFSLKIIHSDDMPEVIMQIRNLSPATSESEMDKN